MAQDAHIQVLLYRARLLLEEGHHAAALSLLEEFPPVSEDQQSEVSYLLGWCYVQRKQWNDAKRVLSPLLKQTDLENEPLQERERVAHFLLHLGTAAVNLSNYEDASLHFTLCLKVLHDRRIHLPAVRIQARFSLAMTCLMRGLNTAAVQHYEEALRLCKHYNNDEFVPDIYYGLCDAYRQMNDYVRACVAGEEALRLYTERRNFALQARMHNVLGRIRFLLGDLRRASDHYTDSLAIAPNYNSYTLVMLNCADLATLRRAEGRFEDARRYCHLALTAMERSDDVHMRGRTYVILGKVTREDALSAEGDRQQSLLEEAAEYFKNACDLLEQTQAYPERGEAFGYWAQTLEDLGRESEAIKLWRSGYKVLSNDPVFTSL